MKFYTMVRYSLEERIFILKSYYKNDENKDKVRKNWTTKFKNRDHYQTIESLVEKFERTGSVEDEPRERIRKVRTPELIEKIEQKTKDDPKLSMRILGQEMGVSHMTAWKIMREDLKKFPYKIQIHQQLTEASVEKRLHFASEICRREENRHQQNALQRRGPLPSGWLCQSTKLSHMGE